MYRFKGGVNAAEAAVHKSLSLRAALMQLNLGSQLPEYKGGANTVPTAANESLSLG